MTVKSWQQLRCWMPIQAFELTPFDQVKCIFLAQDGMIYGLPFSAPPHVTKLSSNLANLLKEYQTDLNLPKPRNGDLRAWTARGVILLGTKPERLTYEVCRVFSERQVVFLLMGKKAQEFRGACEPAPIICTPHPNPFSQGFHGSRPFSRVNEELKKLGIDPIDWRL